MIRRLLSAAALLLLASTAHASTINLLLTTDHPWPTVGDPAIGFMFQFIESPTNNWLTYAPPPVLLASGVGGGPGISQFNVSLDVDSLANVYFKGWGDYYGLSPEGRPFVSLYSAQPPSGPVEDALVYSNGPPWISLAEIGDGLSGDFRYFFGYARGGPIGSYELALSPVQSTAVPEPASMLLFGSGLAAIAAKRHRRRNAVD